LRLLGASAACPPERREEADYFNSFKNSSSLKTFTPNFSALSSFDPASTPATTKSVFLLTDEATSPP